MDGKLSRRDQGQHAEGVAARYLESKGVVILERNVYNRGGELDLIGRDGDTLVFFEVRYRSEGSLTGLHPSTCTATACGMQYPGSTWSP